jgi:hypothetical protein
VTQEHKAGGVAAASDSPAPASPSGEWSDEQHHVAPEGAQRLEDWIGPPEYLLHMWRLGVLDECARIWDAEDNGDVADVLDAVDVDKVMSDLIAARYHANRQDRIAERCDAAEHDPGTPEAWAEGCDCPRQQNPEEGWDVTADCPMHDPRET